MRNKKIWLSPPHMGGSEIKYVQEAFATNWISPAGPNIVAFENELSAYANIRYCAALSSGTAAIHLALIVLGVGRGDEVICSSFTFSGSCNPIAYQGATPVFVDSETQSWNMDPALLEEAIRARSHRGEKPKAMIVVHLYGMPVQIDAIMGIARKYQIAVIEDAAEGLGSSFQQQKLGTFGDIGIYSFNGNKIITSSGGGALVSNNKIWVQKANFLSTQARDAATHYQHSEIGYNYRLSNICAGIGRGQLEVLDERVQQRRKVFAYYQNAFSSLPGISFQEEAPGSFSNRWLTCIVIDPDKYDVSTDDIRLALEDENIESRPLWKPMHIQPVFKDAPHYGGAVSEKLFRTGLCLPSGTSLQENDLKRITDIVKGKLVG
jgi:dTDP-4-amino-4,6-dideoxygalactose transaminase